MKWAGNNSSCVSVTLAPQALEMVFIAQNLHSVPDALGRIRRKLFTLVLWSPLSESFTLHTGEREQRLAQRGQRSADIRPSIFPLFNINHPVCR